jgi:hypothetical protein
MAVQKAGKALGISLANARKVIGAGQQKASAIGVPGGQLQTGRNFETMGSAAYQHILSSNTIGWLRAMARDNSNDFYSNPASWPIIATQHNDFKEIYLSGSGSVHQGRQEWKPPAQ